MVTWTGRNRIWSGPEAIHWLQYTAWADGDNHLRGAIGTRMLSKSGVAYNGQPGRKHSRSYLRNRSLAYGYME